MSNLLDIFSKDDTWLPEEQQLAGVPGFWLPQALGFLLCVKFTVTEVKIILDFFITI